MTLEVCKNCKKEKKIHSRQGFCNVCYKKLIWKPKPIKCKRCERVLPHHAKGLCAGCYNSVFHLDKVRIHNALRYHNIDPELYSKITNECVICKFNKIVEIHHLDHNKANNSQDNLTGLCPNHHKMIHMKAHQKEIFEELRQRGFKVPEKGYKTDGFFKK